MKLTSEDLEFLEKYRALNEYDRGRVAQKIEDLLEAKREGWEVCKKEETKEGGK